MRSMSPIKYPTPEARVSDRKPIVVSAELRATVNAEDGALRHDAAATPSARRNRDRLQICSLSLGQIGRISVPKYLAALTIILLLGTVLTRVFLLKRQGIKTVKFGDIDKTDF